MKNFNNLSGPWHGISEQDGRRISEQISLTISDGRIDGIGKDEDGRFELVGFYNDRSHEVKITRSYSWTMEPSQEGVGIAYDYEGLWDGAMVVGQWHPRRYPTYRENFEMWPDREEDREEHRISLKDERPLALPILTANA